MESYTINDKQKVKTKLELSHTPIGLEVEKMQAKDACVVHCVPQTKSDSHQVSDELLKQWLENGVIEVK